MNFTDWNISGQATYNWLGDVNNTSACIFTYPSELSAIYGDSYIPSKWTINPK